jgi:hypothetical protein
VTVDEPAATVDVLLTVLARDEDGRETADPRRTLRLTGVSRIAASYRGGTWDDAHAPVIPLDLEGLDRLLRRHGGGPVYGWEFVDTGRSARAWEHRLSLDLTLAWRRASSPRHRSHALAGGTRFVVLPSKH